MLGKRVDPALLQEEFQEAPEGSIQMIYGRIRQGKSTEAVRRMLEYLENGRVIYSNILLDLTELQFDERLRFGRTLWSIIVPGDKRFYVFDKANYHYFDPISGLCDGKFVFSPKAPGGEVNWLNTLTDCSIFYDEGQWLLDSYEKTDVSIAKRKLITESGHVGRTIVVIAQRTQSVHVNARGNVNQFFRCSKRGFLFWTCLVVEEFQGMIGNDVDETAEPDSVERHWSNAHVWKVFNTHYLRRGRPRSQEVHFEAYDLTWPERVRALWNVVCGNLPFLKKRQASGLRVSEAPPLGVKSDDTALKNVPTPPPVGGGLPSSFLTKHKEVGSIRRYVGDTASLLPLQEDEVPF